MAIDKMKKVTVICPVTCAQRLIRTVHDLGIVELTDAMREYKGAEELLKRMEASTDESSGHLQQINLILGLIDTYFPVVQGFIAGLSPVPLLIDRDEMNDAATKFDLEAHYSAAVEMDTEHRHIERTVADIQNQTKELDPFKDLPFRVSDIEKTERIRLAYGSVLGKNMMRFAEQATKTGLFEWQQVHSGQFMRKNGSGGEPPKGAHKPNEPVRMVVAYLPNQEEAARKALSEGGFDEIALPRLPGTVRDHLRELEADLSELTGRRETLKARVSELLKHRRTLQVLRAFWDDRHRLTVAQTNSAVGEWVQVFTGYLRERDFPVLEKELKSGFSNVSCLVEDPAPGEDVPVSITLPPLVRPVQMLVNMFGLPPYAAFDPSPFLVFGFLLFFGMCFGDVGYGLMLMGGSWYIMRKTRPYVGLYNFGKLLFMASIPTLFFGFIFGSFFGDLYKEQYLGAGNPMLRLMTFTTIVDPVEDPVKILLLALVIGVLNQFYAIGLKMYGHIKQGDNTSAICDGLLWLITLPGFIILVVPMMVSVPAWLISIGWILFGAGALGLVLTQGREQKNPIARLMTGVVSLYGIVGSYGITAFIGDTMSYCRLLALGLTTSIVAMAFNMIANLLRPIPYVGIVLFIVVVIGAHIFNFFISVLGAFVHSMRLILVEFFGRFYEGGSKPFQPLGFDSEMAILQGTPPQRGA
jgi:V/A-type H+-transporting ATPase subunit I